MEILVFKLSLKIDRQIQEDPNPNLSKFINKCRVGGDWTILSLLTDQDSEEISKAPYIQLLRSNTKKSLSAAEDSASALLIHCTFINPVSFKDLIYFLGGLKARARTSDLIRMLAPEHTWLSDSSQDSKHSINWAPVGSPGKLKLVFVF